MKAGETIRESLGVNSLVVSKWNAGKLWRVVGIDESGKAELALEAGESMVKMRQAKIDDLVPTTKDEWKP